MSHTYCTNQRPFGCPRFCRACRRRMLGHAANISPDGLGELLDKQLSVVSRGQLLALGMTDRAMQYRVRRGGPWQALLPGIYLAVSGTPSVAQKEMAALLYAGPGSLITGPVALLHHGIRSEPRVDVIDVLVPATRQRRSTGFVRLYRTARMPARPRGRAGAAGPGAPRRGRHRPAAHRTARRPRRRRGRGPARPVHGQPAGRRTLERPGRGSAVFRSVLAEVADGIRSTAEGDLRDVIRTARLPMPLFNPSLYDGDLFLGKPDAWWPDAGVAAEVDSRAWHLSPEDWDRTRRRHDRMAAAGIIVLHFSPRELRREPARWRSGSGMPWSVVLNRPPLPIRTIPCTSVRSNE